MKWFVERIFKELDVETSNMETFLTNEATSLEYSTTSANQITSSSSTLPPGQLSKLF